MTGTSIFHLASLYHFHYGSKLEVAIPYYLTPETYLVKKYTNQKDNSFYSKIDHNTSDFLDAFKKTFHKEKLLINFDSRLWLTKKQPVESNPAKKPMKLISLCPADDINSVNEHSNCFRLFKKHRWDVQTFYTYKPDMFSFLFAADCILIDSKFQGNSSCPIVFIYNLIVQLQVSGFPNVIVKFDSSSGINDVSNHHTSRKAWEDDDYVNSSFEVPVSSLGFQIGREDFVIKSPGSEDTVVSVLRECRKKALTNLIFFGDQ
jgi:hypothetical protein